ncbi:MAG: hypothetical protein J6W40_02695 [Alphaproteobacteria bacterium]|nr:hypothetical protein [Alphaproteobacteria bacterium]
MGNFINAELISSETHATFDAFADKVMEHQLTELLSPTTELVLDDLTTKVLTDWHERGMVAAPIAGRFSALDVARASISMVLKRRGICLDSIKHILCALDAPMYRDVSMLQFVVLFCRASGQSEAPVVSEIPLLVFDGNNRVGLCMARDLPTIIGDGKACTYSYTVLNMWRVLNDSEVAHKIVMFGAEDFLELPAKIAQKLFRPETKQITVSLRTNSIKTTIENGPMPTYGELIQQVQDGRVVSSSLTIKERLNG